VRLTSDALSVTVLRDKGADIYEIIDLATGPAGDPAHGDHLGPVCTAAARNYSYLVLKRISNSMNAPSMLL
jgi:hypothetical protein